MKLIGIYSASTHMHIHQKLRLGSICALALLIGTGVVSQYCLKRSSEDAVWVAHTYEVVAELRGLSNAVQSALRAKEKSSVSKPPQETTDFLAAKQQVEDHLTKLHRLTADNPPQQKRVEVLHSDMDQWLALDAKLMFNPATPVIHQIKSVFQQITDEEQRLQKQRSMWSQKNSFTAAVLLGIVTLLSAIFITIGSFRMERELRRREKAETALRQAQEALELRVKERTADLSNAMVSLESEMAVRQKAEQELRQSEQRYRLLFEDNPLVMEIFDPETLAFLAVNKAAMDLYGYTREEFLSMTLKDTRPPEEVPALLEFLEGVKDAEAYSGTFVTQHKSGKLITIEAKVRTIEFGDRKARLKLVTDVTEHKEWERRLKQSQKIEAVGRLAGGIAHDFNNLLTVILGYSESILQDLSEADPHRAPMLEIQAAGKRAANLTGQLLAFSRKQILKPQVLELNSVVSNISRMLRRLLGEDIQISLHLDAALGQVKADPTQLEQVLVNLGVNARDAMPNGGQLVIETHNVELDQHAALLDGVPAGRYVVLVVSDTGCGMSEETKIKAFEPFFTTKEVGKGTGLGLSMVLGVVQQSGGTVTLYSEKNVGTTFKVYLPRVDSVVNAPAPVEPVPATRVAQNATILLVEDEPSLRALARNVLARAGYTVFEAANGKDALKVADQLPGAPDLLLTDVVMPEMSGLELAKHLEEKWPALPVIYTSGYTDHALLERNALREDMPFLQKPYMPAAMLDQVSRILEKSRTPDTVPETEPAAEYAESLAV